MVAGAVDHETGTRFIDKLGGMRKLMPITAVAAVLAGLSMSGIPPFLGFVAKELSYEATTTSPEISAALLTLFAFLTNGLTITAAAMVVVKPFFGKVIDTPKHAHEAPPSMWLGPVILGSLGLLLGLLVGFFGDILASSAVSAIEAEEIHLHLALWHGFNPILVLSAVTIAFGLLVYWKRELLQRLVAPANIISKWGPEQIYQWLVDGTLAFGRWQTRVLQSGYLRYYLIIIAITTVGLSTYTLVTSGVFSQVSIWRPIDTRPYELFVLIMIVAATFMVLRTKSRLAAVAALGVVGYGVALIFVFFSAPDLAMTQFSIETLSVILLVLVLYKLPRFLPLTIGTPTKLRDGLVAATVGGLMTTLVLIITALPTESRLAPYFAENSYKLAHGHNVVNVILVDFRGIDTMGEITVLGVAAIGVYGLLKLRLDKGSNTASQPEEMAKSRQPSDIFPVASKSSK